LREEEEISRILVKEENKDWCEFEEGFYIEVDIGFKLQKPSRDWIAVWIHGNKPRVRERAECW